MAQQTVGLIGLAAMGEGLALNLERNGFPVAVYNRTAERTRRFLAERASGRRIQGAFSLEELVGALATPRKVLLTVRAGEAVDRVLGQLRPLLSPGDVVMDGGNSFFRDTERRAADFAAAGIHYFGVGISGGEAGAREGPSLMPGGPKSAYPLIEPLLTKIAAWVDDGPCCAYIGPGGAGHFVKMAHNGCEYAVMQVIAELYDILAHGVGMAAPEVAEVFAAWNETDVGSYLVELTAKVLSRVDAEAGQPLVDLILDVAEQKGTGRWAAQCALDLGTPVPTIDAALAARNLSALREQRLRAAQELKGPTERPKVEKAALAEAGRRALLASSIASYAQTMALLGAGSAAYGYGLNLGEIARIWRGGCIIRAKLLGLVQEAYEGDPDTANLMVDPVFASDLNRLHGGWRLVVLTARTYGLPCPALSASLDYFDAYRQARLPANLIQALRDAFGAHGYQRVDRTGTYHTDWS